MNDDQNQELIKKYKQAKLDFKAKKAEWEQACRVHNRELREKMGVNDLSIQVGSLELETLERFDLLNKRRGDKNCEKSPFEVCFYKPKSDRLYEYCCLFCHESE